MPRVLIATNESVLAKGLEAVLVAGGLEVTDLCHDVCELFDCIERRPPDVAILAIAMLPSPAVIRDLRRLAPKCHFIAWPSLRPEDSPDRVVEAINLLARFSGPEPSPAAIVDTQCDPAEREIVRLLGYGLNNEEIAEALGADRSTVQKLLGNLSDVLGAEDRCELAMFGLSKLKEPREVGEKL
jgi:DNA-binding NarL/FixJ family response regulator